MREHVIEIMSKLFLDFRLIVLAFVLPWPMTTLNLQSLLIHDFDHMKTSALFILGEIQVIVFLTCKTS